MLHYDNVSIEIPPGSGIPRYVAELWQMHRGMTSPCARCGRIRLALNSASPRTVRSSTPTPPTMCSRCRSWQERWHRMKVWR
jgi:hypothetical protein